MIDGPADTSASVAAPTPTQNAPDVGNVPTIIPTPKPEGDKGGPQLSAIEQASKTAREKLAAGGTSTIEDDPAVVKPKKEPVRAEGRFTGQHAKTLKEPVPTGAEPRGAPTPEGGQEGGDDDLGPDGGGEPEAGAEPIEGKPAPKPKAGEEPAEPVEGAEDEPGPDGEDEGFTVELPGRREGEKVSLVVDDEETANVLKMHANSFQRRQQLESERAEVTAMKTDYDELKDIMEADPAGFALDTFGADPETAERVALTLLSDPRVWERVKERVTKWEDPDILDTERTKIENQNLKAKESLREQIEETRAVSKNLREVQVSVAALIPPDMAEDEQAIFFRDALRDLKEFADRNRRMTLDIADIPLILASSGRLKAHKIDPLTAADRINEARSGTRRPAPAGGKPPATSATVPAKKPAGSPPPPKTGKEMVKGSRARRAAASSPTGAGSPTSAVTPPPGQSIEERLKWHREQGAKGRTLTR